MSSYAKAGVDIDRGNAFVNKLKSLCPDIGGFSGLYPLPSQMGNHYLVATCDGVGTKLKLAFEMNRYETVGIDLVAMCVNDLITTGARPLFLLDYLATSKLELDQAEKLAEGVIRGCQEAGCTLLGGETAEMPGFYRENEYDIAGFAVGIVDKKDLIDGSTIREGDVLVGFASTGVHSNGFSLVRKILAESGTHLQQQFAQCNSTFGELLLTPTRIYVETISDILQKVQIKGLAHITGGGLVENVPRFLPKGKCALIDKKSWKVPPIFQWLQAVGGVAEEEMYRVFNMGIGMVAVLDPEEAHKLIASEHECILIGEVGLGKTGVQWV